MTPDTDQQLVEPWEEKMDELNAGLLEAYTAGFAQAVDTFDIDADFDTSVPALQQNEAIQEAHFYYWDGRTKPLKQWLQEELGDGE